jgi:hypothetical protein
MGERREKNKRAKVIEGRRQGGINVNVMDR